MIFGVSFLAFIVIGLVITALAPGYARVGSGTGPLNFALNTAVWPVEVGYWVLGSPTNPAPTMLP